MNTKTLAQRISLEAIQQYTEQIESAESLRAYHFDENGYAYRPISLSTCLTAYDTFLIQDTPDHSLPLALTPKWIAAEIFELYWNTPYILSFYE